MSAKTERLPGESFDAMLSRFKEKCNELSIEERVREQRSYTKPSKRRREEEKERLKTIREEQEKQEHYF